MSGVSDSAASFSIRRALPEDRDRLVEIWWRSACATHHFLSLRELEALVPEVRELHLETLQTWVLCSPGSEAIGFLVMDGRSVEGLFIAPEWQRRGGGTLLMRHAGRMANRLTVEVNEQNADAIAFYFAQGFEIVRRSATDRSGRPYPLLYLEESSAARRVQAARL